MSAQAYGWLMAGGGGDPFDRHLFACATAIALAEPARPLAVGLGLSAEDLAALVGEFFPHAPSLLSGLDPAQDGMFAQTADEAALRQLLLANRSLGAVEEGWLAHIIARRALSPRPLWQDMGLNSRDDLGLLLAHHFSPLAARNRDGMRWKPFFWREIEAAEGIDCRAARKCRTCRSFDRCFGPECGTSLLLA
ncbi:MAG TPA: nitrogen fixation protein NifQ [Magnetospirillum sp.]|jgi:nitrogen fixation protein NifQ|nr:nitrogen fixation protein NifQ [Magnetospirillum sp.]